jgi:DNA mismatch repair protein MutS
MFSEYTEFYNTYTQKYGPKTAIFLMVGSFYELYDIQNIETGETRCNVKELIDLLGCQASIKKDVEPGHIGLVAGFPDYALHKWAGRLTSIGWTVVVVDQIKDSRGKVKERIVSRILSPSTHIENTTSIDTPYVVTLFFSQHSSSAPHFGVGALDLTTGSTITYSGVANGHNDIWTADDLVQMMSVFQPKELNIYWRPTALGSNPDDIFFRRIFGIQSSVPIYVRTIDTVGSFSSPLVRTEYLQKIYSIRSTLPPKTFLGLRTENEELALMYLLQFVEEHYPSMLRSFHRNDPWTPHTRLICGNHALTQLQMTGSNTNETVIGLFDKCITPMGKRAIRERLLSPYSDATDITQRLNEVQDFMAWDELRSKTLERQLRFMFDLPRLHRKLLCGLIEPNEIAALFQTYTSIQQIMTTITPGSNLEPPFASSQWDTYMAEFLKHFTYEKAQAANSDVTPFNSATYPEIAAKEEEIQKTYNLFQELKAQIAAAGSVSDDALRFEEREKEPFGIKGSTVTLAQLKKNLVRLPENTKISELKSGGWVDCTKLQQLNIQLLRQRDALKMLVSTYILGACAEIAEVGQNIWMEMEEWVSHVDCTQCIGRVSRERAFICPIIRVPLNEEQGSSFDIKNIRHPLVESSATRVAYVKHDVALNSDSSQGWLVYGMNASGKSTLMKATGICILLAQAGCFVPAQEMTLTPFKSIYTRILNQDNLFAGLSSFAVEMSELRDILRNANKNTLVLGDELCAGTESISAQALVASGIQWLAARNAKFIFATHLHDLPLIIDTTTLKVSVWHLHVDYDPMTKKLIYDRSLRPGSGSTLYGLEVARAMDLPMEFIEQALINRNRIIGSTRLADATTSCWNKEIVRKECEVCKAPVTKDLEVHHIKHRASATNSILEDGTHMNDKRNLVVLCEKCHDAIHSNTVEVGEVKMTSDGPEREIITITPSIETSVKPKGKSKWTIEELEIVTNILKRYKSLALKSIRHFLSSKHSIEISEGVLGKMRREL